MTTVPHPYDHIVKLFSQAFQEIRAAGLADVLPKGGVGAILLAHRLGHLLVPGDKGADAVDQHDNRYEYKVSITNQFNFHFGSRFGSRRMIESPSEAVRRHFSTIQGAYCALREGEKFKRIVYCPSKTLVPSLTAHFERTKGGQLNRNFRLKSFLKLDGATEVASLP